MKKITALLILLFAVFAQAAPQQVQYRPTTTRTVKTVTRFPFKLGPIVTTTQRGQELNFALTVSGEGNVRLVKVTGNLQGAAKFTVSSGAQTTMYLCGYYELIRTDRYLRFSMFIDGRQTPWYTDELQPSQAGDFIVKVLGTPYLCGADAQVPPR